MTAQFARTPQRGRLAGGTVHEPHAALLIDFDNVTMGIRSDLTKELKNLLNSDIIKGKVAVQRAYADWRRYPQYIVPLAESSVDLIFAPAYGSAKKNATDIRLAIDAVELVFTRPEIGTIILLSGDSDFSSLVLKLKEYGKYVIGVGIRESASDLLVQNCDEYYSYSALTGLTRAGDELPVVSDDPWELVEMALRQMIDNNDVMRSDRLKQVLLEMDPGFDEKTLGFQKFNKFLQEASSRGLISVRKQENGQYEVGPPSADGADANGDHARSEPREGRSRRGRRGRGRRDEPREQRDAADSPDGQLDLPDSAADDAGQASAPVAADDASSAAESAPAAESASAESAPAESAPAAQRPGRAAREPRGAEPARPAAAASAATGPAADAPDAVEDGAGSEDAAADVAAAAGSADDRPARSGAGRRGAAARKESDAAPHTAEGLPAAYELLRRAVGEMAKKSGPAVRDSDVKRRMLEMQSDWDESTLGFSKFSRFLRQAHDAQVVTLRKGDNGNFDVLLGDGGVHIEESRGDRGRSDRGRGRGRRDQGDTAATQRADFAEAGVADTGATQATPAASRPEQKPEQQPAQDQPPAQPAAAPAAGLAIGFRRGSRGRAAPSGPPPLLEGQAALVSKPAKPAAEAAAEPAASRPAADAPASAQPAADGRGGRPAKKGAKKGAEKAAASAPAGTASRPAAKKGAAPRVGFDPAAFGLPTGADEVANYMSTNYKGVGPKSVEALVEKVGAGGVFDALENKPDLVREVVGGARGERLLEAWADDIAFRRANAAPTSAKPPEPARPGARRGGPGGGRGGPRGGAGAKKGGKRPAGRGTSSRR